MLWRQAILWQHHPTTRHTGQMHGRSAVHARAPKRKRPAMHPHHSPFVVFFPRHFGTLPPISLELVKLPTPRSRIQSGGQLNGVANLLGRGPGNIPPQHSACAIGALQPRLFGPPFRWKQSLQRRVSWAFQTQRFREFGIAYTGWRLAVPSLLGLCSYSQRRANEGFACHSGCLSLAASYRALRPSSFCSNPSAVSSNT